VGKPGKNIASELRVRYSLDKTSGILYYDNVGEKMVLEKEDYIEADFKEYRTPEDVHLEQLLFGCPQGTGQTTVRLNRPVSLSG